MAPPSDVVLRRGGEHGGVEIHPSQPSQSRGRRPYVLAAVALLMGSPWPTVVRAEDPPALPQRLHDTGLYVGDSQQIAPEHLAFSPQYPLWSDGATKRRWIYLPPGASIDASNPDAWEFPVGTRLWKEFAHGRPIETRYIERLQNGEWRFAAYIWNEAGSEARLAPTDGVALEVKGAPRGRYHVPGEGDCRACHEGAAAPVLGFSALQLSPERDRLAPHGEVGSDLDLRALVARGLVRNLPESLHRSPPRIAARSALERAALGYLHGNCAHCHNDNGAPAPVDLTLAQRASSSAADAARVLRTLIDAPSRFRGHGLGADAPLIAPGRPDASVLTARMRSRNPQTQMPPLGTAMLDTEALALLDRWIAEQSPMQQEMKP
jgi:mono/diheme cytochrome c family protein